MRKLTTRQKSSGHNGAPQNRQSRVQAMKDKKSRLDSEPRGKGEIGTKDSHKEPAFVKYNPAYFHSKINHCMVY